MTIDKFINETELRKAIEQIHPDGELFETRIICGKKVISGYFDNVDVLLNAIKTVDLRGMNVYFTLNQINKNLAYRKQKDTFILGANATQDPDVDGYTWLFIDIDPERPAGISSSDDELKEAYEVAGRVYTYLKDFGFEEPIKGISGNGAHLLYRIQLGNTDENIKLVERCLNALAMLFNTDKIKIDTVNSNPSRVCKLYGSLAQKGKNAKERPHRFSKIVGDLKQVKVTDKMYLEKLAAELPEETVKPTRYNNYNTNDFDVEEWLDRYGLRYSIKSGTEGTKYILDECPFNGDHKAPDSMVVKMRSGAIGFKCLHNSCSHYKWQDLRLKFEPDAYEYSDADRRIEEGWKQHNRDKVEILEKKAQDKDDGLPNFLTAKMIYETQEPESEYVTCGINVIDKKLKGLMKGQVSLISGLRGSAKSTLLSQVILHSVENKHTCVCYSGELTKKNFMKWMYLQAAGKGYTQKFERFEGYYCPEEYKPLINEWMGEYLWLYNNNHGNDFKKINELLTDKVKEAKADICIVDNLMALDLSTTNQNDKNEAQTRFVWELKRLAEECNCHVIFVAHPRKAQGFLRLDDVSGSGNLSNVVDNAFIVHRNNADFKRMTGQMFNWKDDNLAYTGTNVIEICKDRENGTQDCFIPLWYEVETKRLKNFKEESIVYSWRKGFIPLDETDEIPF